MNRIDVEVWPAAEAGADLDEPLEFEDVQYISLVNRDTFGIPALIADAQVKLRDGLPVTILYINPENIVAMAATRKE
jgi:hypothetical protein